MKRIIVMILVCVVASSLFTVSAADTMENYNEIYDNSGMSDIVDNLDSEELDVLSELGIDPKKFNSFLEMEPQNLWGVVADMFGRNITAPLIAFSSALAMILLCSLLGGVWSTPLSMNQSYGYVCLLSLCSVVLYPMSNVVENCIVEIKAISGFMLTFVPVYGGILLSSGNVATATVYQSFMLGISELISQIAGFIIAPIISIFICIGVASSISGIDGTYKLALMIKNVANWILGLAMTFFTGFLSIQSVVGKSADSLSIKTTRFFVGSTVPVVGGYLSEALTTITAGLGVLRASAAAWCVLALVLMVLPLIIQLFMWRIVLNLLSAISEMFMVPEATKLFTVSSVAMGFLVAIILCISAMYILSLVVIRVGT